MGKHERTLAAIFAHPTRGNLRWADIESLLKACGASIQEGRGSRVQIRLCGVRATFHRPHPRPETGKDTVDSVREFLKRAGIGP